MKRRKPPQFIFPTHEDYEMAFADLYEIRDFQEFTQQSVLNVYHAEKLNSAFDADDVLTAYLDSVLSEILDIQPDSLDHVRFECQSLDDPLDFASGTATPSVGVLTGPPLTAFTAAAIQFNRLRTDMKNGQKRWVAGTENEAVGNLWVAGFSTLLDTLGQALITNWEDASAPGVPVATFVILNRICKTTPSPPCTSSYRLPENDAELKMYSPTAFQVRDTIRSQVSRKRLI